MYIYRLFDTCSTSDSLCMKKYVLVAADVASGGGGGVLVVAADVASGGG